MNDVSNARLLSTGISLTSTKSVVCLGGKNRPSSSSRRRFRPRSAACLSFAFIVVVAAALFVPTAEAKKRPIRRLDCTPMKDSKTYYLQNQCYDGLVTVRNRKKVVAQSARIDKNSPEARIAKQACIYSGEDSSLLPVTRLYHQESDRYICFNRYGRIKTVSPKRVDAKGDMCAFREVPISIGDDGEKSPFYIQLRSAFNHKWFLGFNRKRKAEDTSSPYYPASVSLPRSMRKQVRDRIWARRKFNPTKCDFVFSTGEVKQGENDFSGLIDHIWDQEDVLQSLITTDSNNNNNAGNSDDSAMMEKEDEDIQLQENSQSDYYYKKSKVPEMSNHRQNRRRHRRQRNHHPKQRRRKRIIKTV